MKKTFLSITAMLLSVTALADSYDLGEPFGFCTRSSRTDASSTYNITGGGCYTYPIPDDFTGTYTVLKSNGQDMKGAIQNAIKKSDIVILDGSNGDFIVSENIGFERGNKTILGINNARLCTQWYLTDEIKAALNDAGVPGMSTSGGGGTLSNGQKVTEEAEYNTRRIIMEMTGDTNENYRKSGIFSLNKENVIIRNITFVGPGSVDVGGNDLISATGAKNCWVDHCTFQDGMDGNFDITLSSDFITVSWCVFRYTDRSYMHQNTNLVGSSDSEATGYLNTTFAFNWWATGCKQRMPMARVGKIHMLNNYYSCTGSSNCINPRKNSEFLIEGNYFEKGVKNYYGQNDATAVTWADNNYVSETVKHSSLGSAVTVPYTYDVAPVGDIPTIVQFNAGATLSFGETAEEPAGAKGSICWPMSSNTDADVTSTITDYIASTKVENGSNLELRTRGTYGDIRFSLYQAQTIQTEADESNAVNFSLTTKSGSYFKATSVELYACKVGTNNGYIDLTWTDGGGKTALLTAVSPNRNNSDNGYYSTYSRDVSNLSAATDGACALTVNIYNVGAMSNGELQKKDIGLAGVIIKGIVTNGDTGVSTAVTLFPIPGSPVEYYNMAGQRVDNPAGGVVIIRQLMPDGTYKTAKVTR